MENNILFGLTVYTDGVTQLISEINENNRKTHIISGNAEVLKYPLKDIEKYKLFCNDINIIIPDGISVYYPMKLKNRKSHKIAGIDLFERLLVEFQNSGKSAYFLGAKNEVVSKMVEQLTLKYPLLNIAGFHHGYFDKNNCVEIITEIKRLQPYALFVALGAPAQENFIFKHIDDLPCTVFMGVGGSFDVFSGTIKRSPKWIVSIGFEWLYRIIKDPSKINRAFNNILFTVHALIRG